jgi:ABC-type multidrug transport system permease subunit
MYGLLPYFLTKNVIELPIALISPAIMVSICYWGIGLNEPTQHFARFYLVIFLLGQVSVGLGYSVSAFFNN